MTEKTGCLELPLPQDTVILVVDDVPNDIQVVEAMNGYRLV